MRFPREDVSLQWKRRLVGEPVTNRKPLASGAGFIVASIMSGLVRGRLATSVPISVAEIAQLDDANGDRHGMPGLSGQRRCSEPAARAGARPAPNVVAPTTVTPTRREQLIQKGSRS
jgi:hypothetical protein